MQKRIRCKRCLSRRYLDLMENKSYGYGRSWWVCIKCPKIKDEKRKERMKNFDRCL